MATQGEVEVTRETLAAAMAMRIAELEEEIARGLGTEHRYGQRAALWDLADHLGILERVKSLVGLV